jgi:hypothetical protein
MRQAARTSFPVGSNQHEIKVTANLSDDLFDWVLIPEQVIKQLRCINWIIY